MAYVAAIIADDGKKIIGVARYSAVDEGSPTLAEVGVVVEDAYQNQGIGTQLIQMLIGHAKKEGVETFTGIIHPTNELILKIIEDSGFPIERRFNDGLLEMEIDIR